MPILVNPKKNTKNSTVSGMFRSASVQTVPTQRSGGMGLTRRPATNVPRTKATR